MSPRRVSKAGGELATVLTSQAVSSGGNFLAALFAAHESGPGRYGPIALLFAFYAVAVQLTRPFAGNVIQIRVLTRAAPDQELARGALAVSFAVACAITALFIPVGFQVFDVVQRNQLLAAAALVPMLAVYDTARLWCISIQRPQRALAMDCAWLVVQVAGMLALHADGRHTGAAIVVVWAASGAVVSLTVWAGVMLVAPARVAMRAAVSAARQIGRVYFIDAACSAVSNTGFVLLLSAVVPVAAIGRLQALEMPFGVLATAGQGLTLYLQPTTRRLVAAGHEERAWRALWLTLSAIVAGAVVLGVVLLTLSTHLLQQIFGPSFRPSTLLMAAIVAKYACFGPVAAQSTMTRSLGVRQRTLGFAVGLTFTCSAIGVVAGIWSLPLSYFLLYLGLAAGSLEIVRRVRHLRYSESTV